MTVYDMIDKQYNIEYGHQRLHRWLAGFQHTIREEYSPRHDAVDLIANVFHNDKRYFFCIRTDERGLPKIHGDWDSAISECMENMRTKLEEQTWL
jgi:hypothetical protein